MSEDGSGSAERPENLTAAPVDFPPPDGDLDERRRLPRVVPVAAVAVVAALVAGSVVLFTGGSNDNADAAVARAMVSTLADKTAKITLSGGFGIGELTAINISGSGAMNFTQNAAQFTMSIGGLGQNLAETIDEVGQVVYIGLPQIAKLFPGKSWVSQDLSQVTGGTSLSGGASSLGTSGLLSSPMATLRLLTRQGNAAQDLGPSTVDGVPVEGYAVTLNTAAITNAEAKLPSWLRQSASFLQSSHVGIDIFVNHSGLLQREAVKVNVPVNGQGVNGDLTMDMSQYGVPVSVTAPPADQVVPFDQFMRAAGSQSQVST